MTGTDIWDKGILLKKPVSNHSSILLGELVAIIITLEHFNNTISHQYSNSKLQIFSDSQTSIGLLTLGWKPNSYFDTVLEAKQLMTSIQEKGNDIIISWSPGHAQIKGNEIADKLAKEAAVKAKDMETETTMTTHEDIRKAAHNTCLVKWQRQWEIN